ncbi:MAG: flippase [Flavobacterium sp.]|nr:MAG: flippase [Flavobacterium sp.]
MNGKNSLIKNILSLGVVQIANYVLPLISIPIIVRIIGPDKFGVINYAAAFITYFNLLISYGFDLTATRQIAKDPDNIELRKKVFSDVFYTQFFLFLLSTVLFIICLFAVRPLALEKLVAVFSFLICVAIVFTQNWLFQALQDLHKVAILNFISKLLFTVLSLLIIKHKSDYIWQPLLIGIIQIVVGVFSFFWAYKKYNLEFIPINVDRIKKLLWDGKTIFFSIIVVNLYTVTNVVVLGLLRSNTEVGYYAAGQKLIDVIGSVINIPLSQALFPFIGLAFSKSEDNGILAVQKALPIVLILTFCVTLFMFFSGPTIIIWFYGKTFFYSVKVFRILAFVPVVVSLSNIFGIQIMINLNMDKLFFRVAGTGAIIGLLLNFVMINYLGYIGTAWNYLIIELYITISLYIILRMKNINPVDLNQFSYQAIKSQFIPLKNKFFNKHL